jgi:hypothetical protein
MSKDTVVMGLFHREMAAKLCDELEAVIHQYDGKLLAVEVLGIMEIIKHNIINATTRD